MAKFIVIGLGNFGAALSIKLTRLGHEVIGVDNSPAKVEAFKGEITHTICLNATEQMSLQTLPLKDSDAVVVAIGEDFGASVHVTALLRELQVKRIIGRVISPVHRTVIQAIGIEEMFMPEEDSAERLSKALDMKGVLDTLTLAEGYSIVEAEVPSRYLGKTIKEVDFRGRYQLNVVTIKKMVETKGLMGRKKLKEAIMGVVNPDYVLKKDDVIVLFGKDVDLELILR